MPLRRPRPAAGRRSFLKSAALAAAAALDGGWRAVGQTAAEQEARQFEDEALEAFPFERIVVPSETAFAEWKRLRSASVSPVVAGPPEELAMVAGVFHPSWRSHVPDAAATVETILAAADALTFPASITALRESERDRFLEAARKDPALRSFVEQMTEAQPGGGAGVSDGLDGPLGVWPDTPPEGSVAYTPPLDYLAGKPFPEAVILLIPTADPTTIPAHLRWGGWNANPPAEHHVAALRSWRDRYGAELVTLTHDVMELRVERRPQTREEALDLAREQYRYCSDIVDQGVGDLSALAALLMTSDWWYFWWD